MELVRGPGEVSSNRVLVSAAAGRFEAIDVVPGTYLVRAKQGADANETRGERTIQVGAADLDGVMIELLPSVSVAGVVRGAPSAPPSPVGRIRAPRTSVMLTPVEAEDLPSPPHQSGTDANGTFTIENIPGGRYRLQVQAYGSYVASATSGSTDLLSNDLTIAQGVPPQPLEILLRDDVGRISATVENLAEGADRPWALLVPQGCGEPLQMLALNGSVEFQGLAPED